MFRPTVLALAALLANPAAAQMTEAPGYEVEVTRDVVYGQGVVRENGAPVTRDLWMDVYRPIGRDGPVPAVIYTHGGSFHIGSPRTAYAVAGAQTASPAEYCRMFAGIGLACFAIEYRLGVEEPVPSGAGYDPDHLDPGSMELMMDRLAIIREGLGLRALDASVPEDRQLIMDTVLSAAEDLKAALDFVIAEAGDLGVDPGRIVLGGFSAGAVTSLNVAHGMNAPVAGLFMLSTAPIAIDVYKTVTPNSAPALVFLGQYDLSGALAGTPPLLAHYREIGLEHRFAWVPGFGHFYPSGAASMGVDATQMSVEQRIVEFVRDVTQ